MGVAPSEYLDFFALKRRVIAIAIKEVNQYADFNIEGEYEKKGRVVIAIRFLIKRKEDDMDLISYPKDNIHDEDKIVAQLKEFFGLQQKDIDKYIKKYGREYINEKITSILISESFKRGAIKNMAGYLKTALTDDFQVGVSSKKIIEKQKRDREEHDNVNKEYEQRMSQYKCDYDKYISKEICNLMLNVEDDMKKNIFIEFEKYLGPGGYLNIFSKEGLNNILIADQFYTFINRQYPDILSTMMSFNEYLKTVSIGF